MNIASSVKHVPSFAKEAYALTHLPADQNKSPEPQPSDPAASSKVEHAVLPPLPELPYRSYSDKSVSSERPYKPYAKNSAVPDVPYEPYKGM